MTDYYRHLLSLDDTKLERFVRDWVNLKSDEYHEVKRFGGSGDLGRDVVGFLTNNRHEGPWHNYQCKQLVGRRLPYSDGLIELAKTLYHADENGFTFPARYFFVAPFGLHRKLEGLLNKPSEFRTTFLAEWDKRCAGRIVANQKILLSEALRAKISVYDFGNICHIDLDEILAHPQASLVLHQHFGADPGPAPKGFTPPEIAPSELQYVSQLVDAYNERCGATLATPQAALDHETHGRHLRTQRERFYDADFFMRYYRDNTAPEVLPTFESDIENGIFDVHNRTHTDTLDCVDAVMAQAASIQPSGPLAPHARISVKQGICHRFANDGRLRWKK